MAARIDRLEVPVMIGLRVVGIPNRARTVLPDKMLLVVEILYEKSPAERVAVRVDLLKVPLVISPPVVSVPDVSLTIQVSKMLLIGVREDGDCRAGGRADTPIIHLLEIPTVVCSGVVRIPD